MPIAALVPRSPPIGCQSGREPEPRRPDRLSRIGAEQGPWPLRGQARIEQVALVGFVAKQRRGSGIDHTGGESWLHKGDFRQ
jgi:hypothetical protein